MKQLLREKILLEEPEDTLPDVELKEPIVISTEEEIPEEQVKSSVSNLISSEISGIYDNIANLKGVLLAIQEELPDRQDLTDILNEIIDERTVNIGMLQQMLALLDDKQKDLLDTGEEVASEIASQPEANEVAG